MATSMASTRLSASRFVSIAAFQSIAPSARSGRIVRVRRGVDKSFDAPGRAPRAAWRRLPSPLGRRGLGKVVFPDFRKRRRPVGVHRGPVKAMPEGYVGFLGVDRMGTGLFTDGDVRGGTIAVY